MAHGPVNQGWRVVLTGYADRDGMDGKYTDSTVLGYGIKESDYDTLLAEIPDCTVYIHRPKNGRVYRFILLGSAELENIDEYEHSESGEHNVYVRDEYTESLSL